MRSSAKSDRWLGLFCVGLALLVIFVWVPWDSDSGLVEKVRRKWVIGDALGPTVAGIVIAIGGALTLLRPAPEAPGLTRRNLIWIAGLLALCALALGVMRYGGPALASLLTETGYRPLRNTLPWKYLGYLGGGTLMITGLTSIVLGRFRWRDLLVGAVATLLIALAYDLPFEDLLLPPNGDV